MDVCLLLLTCVLQLHLWLGGASLAAATQPRAQPCLETNYQSGCREDGGACEFSVSWRKEEADESVRMQFVAVVPELKETDVWTLGLSLGRDNLEGYLECRWSSRKMVYNCSVSNEEGKKEQFGCLSADITYHSPQMECRFLLHDSGSWSRLFSAPVLLHVTSSNVSGSEASFHHQYTSQCRCDVTDCQSGCDHDCSAVTTAGSLCPSLLDLLLIRSHAILMVLSFLLFLPTGVVISRYSRPIHPRSWFRAHVVANSSGVLLMILGLASVLGHTKGLFNVGLHQMVGIICISLALFQALCGFLRPATGVSLQRCVFKYVHRALGAVILGLGTLALLLGALMYKSSVYSVDVAVVVVAIVVEAGLMTVMEVITRKNHMILPPVGYHRVKGEGEGENGENDVEELYTKERERHINTAEKPLHGHTATKRLLLAFFIQAFFFSAVLGTLILCGRH